MRKVAYYINIIIYPVLLAKKICVFTLKIYFKLRVLIRVKSCGKQLRVNAKTVVNKNTYLGNNCNFNGMEINGNGKVYIGNNFHSGKEILLITSYHNYDFGKTIPYDDTYIDKDIIIEDNVWLGSKVIILGGVTIGEGSIVQAGSVVVMDVPKLGIVGGAPAKIFKTRNADHYEKLKNEKSFF